MYILYNNTKYQCRCKPGKTMVYRGLPDDFPAPVDGEISLYSDDDFLMRTDNTSDYLRQTFENGVLTLTNMPEPEPIPEPEPQTVISTEDLAEMALDHEARLLMIEALQS